MRFLEDDRGGTAIAYGLVAAMSTVDGDLKNTFSSVANAM